MVFFWIWVIKRNSDTKRVKTKKEANSWDGILISLIVCGTELWSKTGSATLLHRSWRGSTEDIIESFCMQVATAFHELFFRLIQTKPNINIGFWFFFAMCSSYHVVMSTNFQIILLLGTVCIGRKKKFVKTARTLYTALFQVDSLHSTISWVDPSNHLACLLVYLVYNP